MRGPSIAPAFAIYLWLLWCMCATVADIASPTVWAVKLWGLNPAWGTPGLAEAWLLLAALVLAVRFVPRPVCGLTALGAILGSIGHAPLPGLRGSVMALAAGSLALLPARWRLRTALAAAGPVFLALWLHPDNASNLQRLSLIRRALASIAEKPWGWGYGGWIWREAIATPYGMTIDINDRAHCAPLDWAIIGGVLGAVAMTAFVALALWQARRQRAIFAALVAWSVAMLTFFPTWSMDAALVMLAAAAFGTAEYGLLERAQSRG